MELAKLAPVATNCDHDFPQPQRQKAYEFIGKALKAPK